MKDRAENIMIVDLLRNDLSKVCTPDSVAVRALCAVESYNHLHHLVSSISGTLQPNLDAFDALNALFPGGSITGAPKIRAMEIISNYEPDIRGPYCGSIGYISHTGASQWSIAIRTCCINQNKTITYHAGGAITLQSEPEAEYAETLLKAQAFFDTLSPTNTMT